MSDAGFVVISPRSHESWFPRLFPKKKIVCCAFGFDCLRAQEALTLVAWTSPFPKVLKANGKTAVLPGKR